MTGVIGGLVSWPRAGYTLRKNGSRLKKASGIFLLVYGTSGNMRFSGRVNLSLKSG
jgi:hypothetical protein